MPEYRKRQSSPGSHVHRTFPHYVSFSSQTVLSSREGRPRRLIELVTRIEFSEESLHRVQPGDAVKSMGEVLRVIETRISRCCRKGFDVVVGFAIDSLVGFALMKWNCGTRQLIRPRYPVSMKTHPCFHAAPSTPSSSRPPLDHPLFFSRPCSPPELNRHRTYHLFLVPFSSSLVLTYSCARFFHLFSIFFFQFLSFRSVYR